jgi:hypothetical protein
MIYVGKGVVQCCRWVVLLYCLGSVWVGIAVAMAYEEVGWVEVIIVVGVGLLGGRASLALFPGLVLSLRVSLFPRRRSMPIL